MLRIMPHTVPGVGRSYKHFPDGFELHLLEPAHRQGVCPLSSGHGTFSNFKAMMWPRVHVQILKISQVCPRPDPGNWKNPMAPVTMCVGRHSSRPNFSSSRVPTEFLLSRKSILGRNFRLLTF